MSRRVSDHNQSTPLSVQEFKNLPDVAAALEADVPVAVALSGGPDSMALCWLLAQAAAGRKKAPVIHALTVDHGLRPESQKEAMKVGRALKKTCPHVVHTILKRRPPKTKAGLQEKARHDRYEMMAVYCRRHGIEKLFVAHHREDQAETFLFRLAKGSGIDGLGAMVPRQTDPDGVTGIVRPLLDVPKARLVATCRKNGLWFARDPTNEDPAFARVRLRRSFAVLEEEGLTAKRLAVTAKRMQMARAALDHCAKDAYDRLLETEGKNMVAFRFSGLQREPEEIRLRVILQAARKLAPGPAETEGYGPRRERLEELVQELFGSSVFKRATLGGFILGRDRKRGLATVEREKKPGK